MKGPIPSSVSICPARSIDVPTAIKQTLKAYARDFGHPNLILFVEETIYRIFEQNWQVLFGKIISQLDSLDIKVDMNCLDVKLAQNRSGNNIYIVQFRSIIDLSKLIGKLRKIDQIQFWTEDFLFAREICLCLKNLNCCDNFWLNRLPLTHDILENNMSIQMDTIKDSTTTKTNDISKNSYIGLDESIYEAYSNVIHDCDIQLNRIKKLQEYFVSKNSETNRVGIILRAYLRLISKFKSLKNQTITIEESLSRLKRFHMSHSDIITEIAGQENLLVESIIRPIGIALIVAPSESNLKSKWLLVELIFKNLILGNGVVLACHPNALGSRFPMEFITSYKIPFEMVHLNVIQTEDIETSFDDSHEISSLNQSDLQSTPKSKHETSIKSLQKHVDSPDSGVQTSFSNRKSSKRLSNMYLIDISQYPDLNCAKIDTLILTMGVRKKRIYFSNGPQSSDQCHSVDESVNDDPE